MSVSIDQGKIIANLNKYLDWHNLPVRMDKGGICNGLSTVYVKYALQGRQEEFEEILDRIARMKTDPPEMDEEVNLFVLDIARSFKPEEYNKELNQYKSIEALSIDGNNLTSSFNLGMVTNDNNWSTIIQELNLRDDEVMLVRSVDHAISITKKNEKYKIYDPNCPSGFKTVSNEKELAQELHINAFQYTGKLGKFIPQFIENDPILGQVLGKLRALLGMNGSLGMEIQVIRHPSSNHIHRKFPNISNLYEQYCDPQKTAIIASGASINNLYSAIVLDDNDAINVLFRMGLQDKDPFTSTCLAVALNNTAVLDTLLSKITNDDKDLTKLFSTALACGRKEAFEKLLENDKCCKCFNEQVLLGEKSTDFICEAAGGDVKLLQQLIENYKNNGKPTPLSDDKIAEKILKSYSKCSEREVDAILIATNQGSTASIRFLLEQINKANYKLGEKQWLTYLLEAVVTNQPHKVDFLINTIKNKIPKDSQENIFNSITMSTSAVERTDLSILRSLKSCGVTFSKSAEGVIDHKEKRPIGYLLPIGIMLNKFTDFIKETLLQRDEMKENIKNFKELKKQTTELQSEKKDDDSKEVLPNEGPLL